MKHEFISVETFNELQEVFYLAFEHLQTVKKGVESMRFNHVIPPKQRAEMENAINIAVNMEKRVHDIKNKIESIKEDF